MSIGRTRHSFLLQRTVWYDRGMTTTTRNVPKQRGGLPASWKKAAGMLRGRKPSPVKELKAMRAAWERRMKAFEKRSRA